MRTMEGSRSVSLVSRARRSVSLASEHAFTIAEGDGHWRGEILSDVTPTAEHVFFETMLGREIPDADAFRHWILSKQKEDGSWSMAPFHPGDVSSSSEAYLALRILGMSPDAPEMVRAKAFIRRQGGVAKVRVLTRISFAQFGIFPWSSVPQLPAEFILLPSAFFVNVYSLASWSRTTIIALFVIRHHEPVYALPNGLSRNNDFIDDLFLDPQDKTPYTPSSSQARVAPSAFFTAVDKVLHFLGGLKRQPLRPYALKQCVKWILEHQENEGDLLGLCTSMHNGITSLLLEGYTHDDDEVRLGIEAIERFLVTDETGKRIQCTTSPVWDTTLMTRALNDAGVGPEDGRVQRAIDWIKSQQKLDPRGDWCINNPGLAPGGFCFQYFNALSPDVDDTAAAILALVSHNPEAVTSSVISRAATWICGMQNRDGGWGAFDKNNDHKWLDSIPFNDMDALCDPSTADVTGRVVEAFGLMLRASKKIPIDMLLSQRILTTCAAAVRYLTDNQELMGWFGRWGVNYIYGTSNVLCGLQYFADDDQVRAMMSSAASWLKHVQNADGGWGECLESYQDKSLAGRGPSTPSQTAWGLMGLLACCNYRDEAVRSAVLHLVRTQHEGSWKEERFTGTGFPGYFYLGYSLYRHYFPLMALGRYVRLSGLDDCEPAPRRAQA